ncbi:MAG: ATP-dependent helicase HrpB [Kiritimatiellae bacterium]|nr:ATP-dependent helicase HrpB [Kiritimatiellia bacterium]
MSEKRFPVEEVISAVAASLAANRDVVLRAPPGSGKTTCVPPALLDAPWLAGKKILMLEPRRLAARGAAAYIASKFGEEVGGTVGYAVRLERKVSSRTRLEIVTEGLLSQRLLNDPELSDVGLVIFDEFHERSLQCDLGFAMALDARRALRPDLRLLVMSATLDTETIAAHLEDADVHTAEARMFPVETRYLQVPSAAPIWAQAAGAVRRALSETEEGDILCFLPGEGEIKRCAEELNGVPDVFPLYGALSKEEQDRAVLPPQPGRRRIILATSIAETSLTIPGVTVVVDSGLMRVSRFSPSSGMSRLETLPLTLDRAEQRRGRAGRVRPGVCWRLWTERENAVRPPAMKPEMLEADLASTVLSAALWGTVRIDGLPWLTPPPESTWGNAVSLLQMLGALDGDGRITEAGRRMAKFAAHPRLANMMIMSGAADLAAIIEEGAPHGVTDIHDVRQTSRMKELARRWRRMCADEGSVPTEPGEALAYAFPDRIGRNRGNGTFQLSGGRGAFLDRTEFLSREEFLVCCDLDDRDGDARIRLAAAISRDAIEEIFADRIRECETCSWDRRQESVKIVRQRTFGKMVIEERDCQHCASEEAVQNALFDGIRRKGVANLPCWTKGTRRLQARIDFIRKTMSEADLPWPDVSDEGLAAHLEDWFSGFVSGMTRWVHLERLDIAAVMDFALSESGHDRRELDRLAPAKMDVPSGSEITIQYEDEGPFCEVRLQECFGMLATPKVAGGKVPVVMRLLSPAQRPVQVTKDLASFWKEGYPLVRKDMRGRYPKHYWPEDPFTAVATRRVRPQ